MSASERTASFLKLIAEMLPELIPVAVDAVITLVDALIDNIDLLLLRLPLPSL